MPNFQLLRIESDIGLDLAFSSAQLMSIMAFPSDSDAGGLFLKEMMATSFDEIRPRDLASLTAIEKQSIGEIELSVLRGELSKQGRVQVRDNGTTQYGKGIMAGEVLLFALRCGRHQPQHRSISKAIFVLSEKMKALKDGNYLPAGAAKLGQYWTEFKAVAHLHAADVACDIMGIRWYTQRNGLEFFLLCAEEIASMAHNQLPPIGRTSMKTMDDGTPLLDPDQTVRVLHNYYGRAVLVPEIKDEFLSNLSSEEIDILSRYRRDRRELSRYSRS